jgi:hypothetical protein
VATAAPAVSPNGLRCTKIKQDPAVDSPDKFMKKFPIPLFLPSTGTSTVVRSSANRGVGEPKIGLAGSGAKEVKRNGRGFYPSAVFEVTTEAVVPWAGRV